MEQSWAAPTRSAPTTLRLIRSDKPDAPTNAEATAELRITVKDADPSPRWAAGSPTRPPSWPWPAIPGSTSPRRPPTATAYGVFWPALVPGRVVEPAWSTPTAGGWPSRRPGVRPEEPAAAAVHRSAEDAPPSPASRPTRRVPLGTIIGARSGDKGGNANVGLWASARNAFAWLRDYLTIERCRPAARGGRARGPSLRAPRVLALNFVVVGLLGEGVASSTRPDPQAKSLGEYVRSRLVDIPVAFLPDRGRRSQGATMDFTQSDEQRDAPRGGRSHRLEVRPRVLRSQGPRRERTEELGTPLARLGSWGQRSRGVRRRRHGNHRAGPRDEELAAAGCPLLIMVVSPAICATIIAKFGTDEQKQRWLPGFATGDIKMAFAITEPDAGSNSHNLSLSATKDGDIYRLNGSKYYISGVDEADAVLVVTRSGVDKETGRGRLSLFVVDADAPGLEKTVPPLEINAPEKQFTLFFDNVQVDAARLIGAEGEGLRQVFFGLNPERILSASMANGISRYVLDKAASYAAKREVWGTPIGRHQGISHPLAKAKIEVELARLMTDKASWLCDHAGDTPEAGEAANMAKYAAAEATAAALDQAIQTHGGNGMSSEYGLADLWGMVRLLRIAPVSREMILNFVAQHSLGLPKSY